MTTDPTQTTEKDTSALAIAGLSPVKQDFDRWRLMLKQIRRLIRLGCKAGRPWDAATNVGEVATACQCAPSEVVQMVDACGWLVSVVPSNGPIETWEVFEDGE